MTTTRGARSPVNQAIADEIAAARGRARISQQEVAAAAGLDRYAYRRYELGERKTNTETLAAIAKALGMTASELWLEAERQHPEAFSASEADVEHPTPDELEELEPGHVDKPEPKRRRGAKAPR